jgi:hypothetical protein
MKTDVETPSVDGDAASEDHVFDAECSNPSANVVLKSSNGVLFRVDDFYLKANR